MASKNLGHDPLNRNRLISHACVAVVSLVLSGTIGAADTIYRCATTNGQPLFSNMPCESLRRPPGATGPANAGRNAPRTERMAQLRHITASRVATPEQRAAAHDELNRYERVECRLTDEQAFYRDKLYVNLGEGNAAHREQARLQLVSLLNACFSGAAIALRPAVLPPTDGRAETTGDKIYRCKTNQGALFWASNWCNTVGGVTIDVINVPPGMPFKEQAAVGDQLVNARGASVSAESEAKDRGAQCGAIDRELREIWNRYEGGKYVPVEQVDRDQIRQRDLTARRNSLGCASR